MRSLITLSFLGALAAGCYGEGGYGPGYSYGYAAASPNLVEVSPGVQVIADYDYPVFYSDNYYWRYDNGAWFRSNGYNGGWAVSYDVPYRVRSIDRPYNYAHYRGGSWNGGYNRGYTGENRGYNSGYRGGPVVRDQRTFQAPRTYQSPRQPVYQGRTYQQAPSRGPAVRDHRR